MGEQLVRVLVVDDEPQIRRLLRTSLGAYHYQVTEAARGEEAIAKTATDRPDILILDLGLPDVDGLDVIRRIREWSSIPIIVLSVRDRETDKIQALDYGADDYVTKPFSIGELLARIRATLRHRLRAETDQPVYHNGPLTVDLARRLVTLDGQEVRLGPKEYDILRVLVTHSGKVITHQQLLRQVWGPGYENETHYLRVHIGQIRQKIEANPAQPHYIITEPGVGYRLRDPEDSLQSAP